MNMSAKSILITGGNRSIGFGIVQRLAQRSDNNNIIIASRKKEDAEKAISELKGMEYESPFHAIALDVTNDDSIRDAVAEVEEKFGKLDGTYPIFAASNPNNIGPPKAAALPYPPRRIIDHDLILT